MYIYIGILSIHDHIKTTLLSYILNPLVIFFDSGSALCLSHWCDLLLGFWSSAARVGRPHGWRPVETQRYIKATIFDPLLHGISGEFVSMKLFVEQLKLAREMKIAEM